MHYKVQVYLIIVISGLFILVLKCAFCSLKYIHGVAARGVHYLHRPGPTLQDLGFFLLPELGQDKAYISETVFMFVFLSFLLWTFHPFVFKVKKFYTVQIWCRVLAYLVVSANALVFPFCSGDKYAPTI
ncbi:hypothetical protein Golax_018939, partial [Gossypium laxum]|nr:hypothetical protein [Gossypium laxum]